MARSTKSSRKRYQASYKEAKSLRPGDIYQDVKDYQASTNKTALSKQLGKKYKPQLKDSSAGAWWRAVVQGVKIAPKKQKPRPPPPPPPPRKIKFPYTMTKNFKIVTCSLIPVFDAIDRAKITIGNIWILLPAPTATSTWKEIYVCDIDVEYWEILPTAKTSQLNNFHFTIAFLTYTGFSNALDRLKIAMNTRFVCGPSFQYKIIPHIRFEFNFKRV